MDQYERSIREKVYAANILTLGEWVYLVGTFQMASEAGEREILKQMADVRDKPKKS